MGQAFVADCDSGNQEANLRKLAVESSPCETGSSSKGEPKQAGIRKEECCHTEGEAAVEIRIHTTHRNNQVHHSNAYDYPHSGAGVVWSPGGITPRARAMSPFTRSSKPASSLWDTPHFMQMSASDHLWGLEGIVAPMEDLDAAKQVFEQHLVKAAKISEGARESPSGQVGPMLPSSWSSEHESLDRGPDEWSAQQPGQDFRKTTAEHLPPVGQLQASPNTFDAGAEAPGEDGSLALPASSAASPQKGLLEAGPSQFWGPMPTALQCAPPNGVATDDSLPSDDEEGFVQAVPLPKQAEFLEKRPGGRVPTTYATSGELSTCRQTPAGSATSRQRDLVPMLTQLQHQSQTHADKGGPFPPVHPPSDMRMHRHCDEQHNATMVDCPAHSNDLAGLEPMAARCLLTAAWHEDSDIDAPTVWTQGWQDDDLTHDQTAEVAADKLLAGLQKRVVQEIAAIGQPEAKSSPQSSPKRYSSTQTVGSGKSGRTLSRVAEEDAEKEAGKDSAPQMSTPVVLGNLLREVSPEENNASFE